MRQLRNSRLVGNLGLGTLRDYDTSSRRDSGIGWNTLVKGGAGILRDDGESGWMVVMLLLLFLMMKWMECRVIIGVFVGVMVMAVVNVRGGVTKVLVLRRLVLLLMLLRVAMVRALRWMVVRWVLSMRMRVRVGMLGIIINRPRVEVVLDRV